MRRSLVALVCLCTLLLPQLARAAPIEKEWSRTLTGNSFVSVSTTPDGVSVVGGSRMAPGGRYTTAAIVAVYGPNGGLRWKDVWRPKRCSAQASVVAFGTDGGVYAAGSWRCPTDELSRTFWYLRRYTAAGERDWLVRQSPADMPFLEGWSEASGLAARPGGGVIVAGSDTGCCDISAGQDGWVLAFGADGRLLWTNPFEPAGFLPVTSDAAMAVVVARGAIYVGGSVADGTPAVPWRDREPVVLRLSSAGGTMWTRALRDQDRRESDFDEVASMSVAAARPVAFLRMEDGSHVHGRLLALTPTGATAWTARTPGWPGSLAGTPAGRLYAIATRGQTPELRAFTPHGDQRWAVPIEPGLWDLAFGDGSLFASGYRDDDEAYLVRFEV
jgi:hypothetical protein